MVIRGASPSRLGNCSQFFVQCSYPGYASFPFIQRWRCEVVNHMGSWLVGTIYISDARQKMDKAAHERVFNWHGGDQAFLCCLVQSAFRKEPQLILCSSRLASSVAVTVPRHLAAGPTMMQCNSAYSFLDTHRLSC